MCGRYTLSQPDAAALRARFGLSPGPEPAPRFNIAPGDPILAVTHDRADQPRAEQLRWGLVPAFMSEPTRSGMMINARAETVAEKPAFASAFQRRRCLIPADGFYEWARLGDGPKRAHHITRGDGHAFMFAGLWSIWHAGRADELRSATIITTAANPTIAPLHDRMPVILDPAEEDLWLDPGTPIEMLDGLLGGLSAEATNIRPVGPAVNDARHDGPDCLDDATSLEPAQTALF